MEEMTSFNAVFAEAKTHNAYLDSFYQDADGQFAASWRAGPHILGARRGAHVRRIHPYNAARDALLALINDAEPGEAAPPVATEDLFG